MAPRTKKSVDNTQNKSALQPRKSGLKKAATKRIETKKAAARDTEDVPQYNIKRHKNGRLNFNKIPDYLVKKAQRNAVESPLLRLPPELRIKIWTLAVKVDRAQVTPSLHHWTYKPTTPQKGGAVAIEEDGGIIMQHPDPDLGGCCPTRQCGAFHLPEVCRQIYVEAATLAYSSNIFTVDRRFFLLKNWARTSLLPAQRDAIAAVELDKDVLRDYLLYQPRRPLVACGLRNLTHVHVSLHTQIDYLRDYPLGSPTRPYNADVWCWLEEEFKAKFKQTEGTDLAVILEDYDDTEPDAEED